VGRPNFYPGGGRTADPGAHRQRLKRVAGLRQESSRKADEKYVDGKSGNLVQFFFRSGAKSGRFRKRSTQGEEGTTRRKKIRTGSDRLYHGGSPVQNAWKTRIFLRSRTKERRDRTGVPQRVRLSEQTGHDALPEIRKTSYLRGKKNPQWQWVFEAERDDGTKG